MKKRLLAVLLTLAIVLGMIVVPAYATEEETEIPAGYCQHCKSVIPENEWLAWDETDTVPRTGHYYLTRDVAGQTNQIIINLDDDLLRNTVCLDLRGKTYTVSGVRAFLIYGVFSVMDTVGGGEFAVTGATGAHGAFAMLGKNSNSKNGSGELNIYSGTLRRINTPTEKVAYGGLIYNSTGGTLNVYGGTLIGGNVVPQLISKTNYAPQGGTIYSTAAYVNIYGGTVTGGIARSGTLLKVGSTTETQNYEGSGGNIYMIKGGALNISGGVIENGFADVRGGNICASGTDVTISGGTIRNGATVGAAGNLEVGGTCKLVISGGTITGGSVRTRGGNFFVNDSRVTVEISGGTIDGDMSVGLFKSFTLSGSPKIYMGNANGLRLQRATDENASKDQKMNISGLTEGAVIYLDGARHDPVFTEVLENPQDYLGYFKDAIRADISVDETGALKVEQGTTGYCPHCWKSGKEATWTEFDNSKPSTNLTVESQHAYLTAATSRTRLLTISAGVDYVIDAAGKTLTVSNYKFANLYGVLSIMDSVGNGGIAGTGHAGANGGVIMSGSTGEFHMYSGTLKRVVNTGEETKRVFDGGVIYSPVSSKIYIHGGIIRDGIASIPYKNAPIQACGGNIYAAGTFAMTGGVLLGGKAESYMGYVEGTTNDPINTTKLYVGSGGNLYVSGSASISGGHIIGGQAGYGGNVYVAATNLQITGGVIRDGVTNQELNTNDWGGNIYYTGVTDGTVENALIRGGSTANLGGNINLYNSTVTVSDSLIAEGNAGINNSDGRGGNLYVNGTSTLNLENTTVGNGTAYNVGGNLYAIAGASTHMEGGIFSGGTAETGSGGSIYAHAFHMTGGRVVGGVSKAGVGGNISIYGGENSQLLIEAAENAPAPVVANGTSGKLGGNINIAVNATCTLTGVQISGGKGDTKNSTGIFNAHNIFANEKVVLTMTDCTVTGITADSTSGNGVYAAGELILKGNTTITNEERKSCTYIASAGKLTVDANFTGTTSVAFENSHFTNVDEPQGSAMAEKNSATGIYSGTVLLEGYNGRDYGLPALLVEENDPRLYVASTAVVSPTDDAVVWYKDAQSAVSAADSGSYILLQASENTVQLQGDLTVDLNGKNLTVTGSGTVYGFDSENDDYDGCGTVTASGVTVEKAFAAPNGHQYVTVTAEDGISFHRLGVGVSSVVLRPGAAGIYYRGNWQYDKALEGMIKTRGIALSVEHMPTENFRSDTAVLYTEVSGDADTSVLVKNIIKSGEDNQKRGTTPIYAAAYAIIDDGTEEGMTIIREDADPTKGGVSYTLRDVMQKVNRIWPALTEKQQDGIRTMYAVAPQTLETWDLFNITGAVNGTPAVRPLKILTIGHSLAVDSGHMLNLVADAEGYDQEFEIATLYYSGCPLYKHVNYLTNDTAAYTLYLSSTATPDKPPVTISGMTMKRAVAYDDWDIIIMQGGVFEIAEDVTYTDGKIQIIQNYVNQYKTNPDALFAWHMPWALPTDNTLRDMYPYTPNTYYTNYVQYNDDRTTLYNAITGAVERNIVTDPSFVYLIPSGTAIENALSSYLEESDLHRDYAHVTDLGRVIASYTWYCTLTGIDQLDEIKLDTIPKAFFKSTTGNEDRVLTEDEKAIILESVNNALAKPLEMTQSQYTTK